jgi:rod shape determining protein RodA
VARYRSFRDLDWPLLILALSLCALGILQIYSATHGIALWKHAWLKQLAALSLGLILMVVVTSIDYHTLLGQTPVFYGVAIALLLVVAFAGESIGGARRWIQLPFGLLFQVSEFVKLVIILLVARYLTELKRDQLELRDLLKLGALVGLPVIMIARQPDLGTALTLLPVLAAGIFLAGLRWRYVLAITLLGVVSIPVGWQLLHDYQRARLVSFMDPGSDPKGDGYQVIQSTIAVGSGGMWGKGVTRGTQTQLRFLPVPHTDFIFAAFAEEHGFVAVVLALGLYFFLLMQIVQNAQTAPDRAGMYLCMGVAAVLGFHVVVNVGMVVGRMPVTGIPLPLMSYGGTSMLSVFMMLGLVNNVRLRRFVN